MGEVKRLQALLEQREKALRHILELSEGITETHALKLKKGQIDEALWMALRGLERVAEMAQRGLFVEPRKIFVEVMDLTEAAPCPCCGEVAPLQNIDGDTVRINYDSSAARLFSVRDGFACHAVLNAYECAECGGESYEVMVSLIENPAISEDWANAYFWLNEVTPETQKTFAVLAHGLEDAPPSWEIARMETAAGILDHAILGPFAAEESLSGPHGVANCAGGAVWSDASALIDKVWPVLVAVNRSPVLPVRFEIEVEADEFSDEIPF